MLFSSKKCDMAPIRKLATAKHHIDSRVRKLIPTGTVLTNINNATNNGICQTYALKAIFAMVWYIWLEKNLLIAGFLKSTIIDGYRIKVQVNSIPFPMRLFLNAINTIITVMMVKQVKDSYLVELFSK